MNRTKTYQEEFRLMFEKGKDLKDLALIIDRVNQIKSDDFISRAVVIDDFEIAPSQMKDKLDKQKSNQSLVNISRLSHYFKYRDSKYLEFEIPKSSGDMRLISAPDSFLKKILRALNDALEIAYDVSDHAHGFVCERSIRTNAELHTNKSYVLNVDVENFFPSVSYFKIKQVFISRLKWQESFAHVIAHFCCYKGVLPQGAPTSPLITNLICFDMDQVLAVFAKKYKQNFTRYADDITFSGYRPVYDKPFFGELIRIIKKEGFKLKYSKTRIQSKNKRQEVTGVVVNDKLNVNRQYVRNLRAMIHHYKSGKEVPDNTENVIRGKLEFLKMIKGKERVYKNLMNRFINE
ncbi:reverse transcriptase family protein [Crocinitomicaceae bacterium]|nr:reverse transcriptase family protein [Crocinitomicaceae bacterium]